MSQPTTCIFRELTSPADFHAAFALRYEILSRTPGLCHLDSLDPVSRLDVDGFDCFSRQFGVFEHSSNRERLLGGLRVTGLDPSPHRTAVRLALADAPTALAQLERERSGPLPSCSFSVERERFARLVYSFLSHDESVVEAGRLVMLSEMRIAGAMRRLQLARDMVEAVTARFFFATPVRNALVNCRRRHGRFYAPFGFRQFGGDAAYTETALDGTVAVSLHARPEWVPRKTRVLLQEVARELRSTGQAVLSGSVSTRAPALGECVA